MNLLGKLPIFPLYYNGETKFVPISADDLSEIILKVINDDIKSKTIECIGPEIISLKEILQRLLILIDKKKLLVPMPLPIAKLTAKLLQLFPKPLLTEDQLKLLSYDNIPSGNFKTNFDIGVPSIKNFDEEVEKYCYMYKEAGQFSTKKYN